MSLKGSLLITSRGSQHVSFQLCVYTSFQLGTCHHVVRGSLHLGPPTAHTSGQGMTKQARYCSYSLTKGTRGCRIRPGRRQPRFCQYARQTHNKLQGHSRSRERTKRVSGICGWSSQPPGPWGSRVLGRPSLSVCPTVKRCCVGCGFTRSALSLSMMTWFRCESTTALSASAARIAAGVRRNVLPLPFVQREAPHRA